MPTGNTGILIFTPKIKAATLSAAEMVKAALLRIFNLLLNINKYGRFSRETLYKRELNALEHIITDFEGSYDDNKNYDDLIVELEESYGDKIIIQIIKNYLKNYKVYFVLNQFNDIEKSANDIINPFIDKIYGSVSSNLSITNLGWIIDEKTVEKSTEYGIPYMVMKKYQTERKEKPDIETNLRKTLGLPLTEKTKFNKNHTVKKTADNEIHRQLDVLKEMITNEKSNDPEQNFNYIADRIKTIEKSSIHDIGMKIVQTKEDIIKRFFHALQKPKK
jgi:hypothetical protein